MGWSYGRDLLRGDNNVFGYRKPIVNQLFLAYCLIGGIYFENRIPPAIRCAWLALNMTYSCALISSNVYFAMSGNYELSVFLLLILGNGMGLFATIGLPLILYRYRTRILAILSSIDDDFGHQRTAPDRASGRTHLLIWAITVTTILNSAVYVYFGLVDMAFNYDRRMLQDPYHHLLYSPLIPYCTSLFAFVVIYAIEILLIIPCVPFPLLYPMCILLIATAIRAGFFGVCDQLADIFSRAEARSARPAGEGSLALDGARWTDGECDLYWRQVVECVQQHQKLVRIYEDIKPWIELCVSITIMPYFVCQIVPVYVVLMLDYSSLVKVKLLTALVLGNIFLYAGCLVGEIIADINERVIADVYSIPWIRFSQEYRKVFNIVQGQMQYPIRLRAFKRWPASIQLFPAVVKLTYTYINAFYHLKT